MNTRDLGLNHGGVGKGDADRTTNVKSFRSNFDLIDWQRKVQAKQYYYGACGDCGGMLYRWQPNTPPEYWNSNSETWVRVTLGLPSVEFGFANISEERAEKRFPNAFRLTTHHE